MITPPTSNIRSDTEALKSILLAELPRLIDTLFHGRFIERAAHEYRIGKQGSISIRRADGAYFNHETGQGGDVFTLIQHELRVDFMGARAWVKAFVGQNGVACDLSPVQPHNHQWRVKADAKADAQRSKAMAMLKRSLPIINTLAEAYLRHTRGIAMDQLPESLRFIEHAYNFKANGFHPAMIAEMCDVEGNPIAVHCTFLDPSTGDKLKGDGIKSRLIFGGCRGGAIRLAPATERLAICEGIEDALSVMQSSDWPVWATGGTSNLRSVVLPDGVREVMLCIDNDDAGREAAKVGTERFIAEGRSVRIATPPAPHKDFNAALMAAHHAE